MKQLFIFILSIQYYYAQVLNNCNRVVFQDDFSAQHNWQTIGNNDVSIVNGSCLFINMYNGQDVRIINNFGSTLSDNYFKASFDFKINPNNPIGNGVGGTLLALTAGNLEFLGYDAVSNFGESNQDGLALIIYTNDPTDNNPSNWMFLMESKKSTNRSFNLNTSIHLNPNVTDYFIDLERINKNALKLSIFADSVRTIHLTGSPTQLSIDSTITSINTIEHGSVIAGTSTRMLNATIDNDYICDAKSSNTINEINPFSTLKYFLIPLKITLNCRQLLIYQIKVTKYLI